MTIATNIPAMNVDRHLKDIGRKNAAASEKLSSGLRINKAADDSAGLAISEKMKAQIRGLKQAQANTDDGINLLKTMEGGLEIINNMMLRQRELIIQALNDANTVDDREKIQMEIDQLTAEIRNTAENTQFNTIPLLNVPSITRSGATGGAANPTFSIYTPPMPPVAPLPATSVSINLNSLTGTASGTGWSFSGGVLTLTSNMAYEITGTGAATANRIEVQPGITADIVLKNVNIMANTGAALDMHGTAGNITKVNLWAEGNNHLETRDPNHAGIETTGGELVIEGSGFLTAISFGAGGSSNGAGIGGAGAGDGGTITINSGTVTAISGDGSNYGPGSGAGIGGGHTGNGGNITINGGTVTARSSDGSGIGSGESGLGGTITINGGIVNAAGGYCAPGIGGRDGGSNITINDGVVRATGGDRVPGIGCWITSIVDNILIRGGLVFAVPGDVNSAAIGGGSANSNAGANVTIEGGLVEIPAGSWIGAGGTGNSHGSTTITGGNLSINDPGTNIRSGAKDGAAADAYRVQISLRDNDGNDYKFPAHAIVTYTIGTKKIDAITDSDGNLFMYLPVSDDGEEGKMETINHYIFNETLSMSSNHGNTLILKLTGYFPPEEEETTSDTFGPLWIQGGANYKQGMYIDRYDCRPESLYKDSFSPATITVIINGMPKKVSLTKLLMHPRECAEASLIALDKTFDKIISYRANVGAQQNRLEVMSNFAGLAFVDLESANSRIEDTNMAQEAMGFAKYSNLLQISMNMMAQANQSMERVLEFLQQ